MGLALSGTTLLWIGLALNADSYAFLAPGLVVWGVGITFLFAPPRTAIMNMVSVEKHGQASGIVMTAQLLGGTIGMSICSMLFSMTGDFRVVFLATAAITLAVLIIGWLAIARPAGARRSVAQKTQGVEARPRGRAGD